jgi:hypothetical protein
MRRYLPRRSPYGVNPKPTDTFSASANRRPDLALQQLAKAINAEHTRYPFN